MLEQHTRFSVCAAVAIMALGTGPRAGTVTFETGKHANTRWSVKWAAQGLRYPEGVVVEKIDAVLKDGMTNNRAKIEFYKDYDGAGNFSGLIHSQVFTIPKPNNGASYSFSPPVELSGAADGLYYLKISPAEGGVVHSFYVGGDDGGDTLRHGVGPSGGMACFSNAPRGLGNDVDLAYLKIHTDPLSKEAAAKARRAFSKNVVDFGAKGDGKTNDTAAFAEAFAGGGSVHVPPGTYVLGPTPLNLPRNSLLRGDGRATILKPTKDTGELLRFGHGARVRDLFIDGKDVKSGSVGDGLLVVRYADGCLIDSVVVRDCDRACVMSDHGHDLTIRNCDFRNVGLGISLVFSNRIKVLANTVVNARVHGIQFWGSWSNGKGREHEKILSEDLIFANNYVKNGGGGAIWGAGGRRVVMTGNIVDGCKDVGLDPEHCEEVVITGNITRNCYNAGISLFYTCKRVSITGNTIYNNSAPNDKDMKKIREIVQSDLSDEEKTRKLPWYVRSGIWLVPPNRQKMASDTGHEDITIVGNTIHTTDNDGIPRRDIWIGSEVKNVRIESNALSDHGVYYGGHHMVYPQALIKLSKQPLLIDNMPTPDNPKF